MTDLGEDEPQRRCSSDDHPISQEAVETYLAVGSPDGDLDWILTALGFEDGCPPDLPTSQEPDECLAEPKSSGPLWTQDQAIAYQAARDAINDVIAGYSAQIAAARAAEAPNSLARVKWLEMRVGHAVAVKRSLHVTDDENVQQAADEYNAVFHTQRDA